MSKICCFTGHRSLPKGKVRKIYSKTCETIRELVNEGYTDFRTGGAVGYDTLAATCVLQMKKEFPQIKLHLILPCENQEKNFKEFSKKAYLYILNHADSTTYVCKHYFDGVMAVRNRALVNGADTCVACLTKLRGGTFQTVNMARRAKVKVINVAI